MAKYSIIDGHNDLPMQIWMRGGRDLDRYPLRESTPGHTDLARIEKGCLHGQFWSVFVPGDQPEPEAVVQTLEQMDVTLRMIEAYDEFELCLSAADIERAMSDGKVASLIGVEGGHSIGSSLGVLRILHAMGMRYLTLTHNQTLDWADSATDEGRNDGLTDFGREVVRELNRLAVAVDLSHVAHRTMEVAIETTSAPVIFSHSSAFSVTAHQRNVPDHILSQLPNVGGVCMVNFLGGFINNALFEWMKEMTAAANELGKFGMEAWRYADTYAQQHPRPDATLDDVVAHTEHIREVAGIDHVGIGADFDGGRPFPVGLEDVGTYPALFDALADRGWSSADLDKLGHKNIIRVLHEIEDAAS